MGPLLAVLFFVALLVFAPIKAAVAILGALLLATLAVQATTATISHVNATLTESFKAIVLAVLFTGIAMFTITSFMVGVPRSMFANPASMAISGVGLMALQYGSFVMGFRLALGLTFLHSAIVAVVSTAVTSVSIWFIAKMVPQG